MVDINQYYLHFQEVLYEKSCTIRKNSLPLHHQTRLIDCFRLVVIFIVLGF